MLYFTGFLELLLTLFAVDRALKELNVRRTLEQCGGPSILTRPVLELTKVLTKLVIKFKCSLFPVT